jgi:PPK2 family polyphosphate:nucleotide phosphotransferase
MPKLSDISTRAPKGYEKEVTKESTKVLLKRLRELQPILYAEAKYSLLIILQGMDASGKDGAVKAVFSGVNPMGCDVQAFKKPTPEEYNHDFLWRVHRYAPAKGMIQIFNRSHYEDILVPTVHKTIDADLIKKRYGHINDFERLLAEHNTIVFKFYLHISQEEQSKRFEERVTDKEKQWKYRDQDLEEAKKWGKYMDTYEEIFSKCNAIPWHIVPSDQNWYKEHYMARIVVEKLETLGLKYPGFVEDEN